MPCRHQILKRYEPSRSWLVGHARLLVKSTGKCLIRKLWRLRCAKTRRWNKNHVSCAKRLSSTIVLQERCFLSAEMFQDPLHIHVVNSRRLGYFFVGHSINVIILVEKSLLRCFRERRRAQSSAFFLRISFARWEKLPAVGRTQHLSFQRTTQIIQAAAAEMFITRV